MRLTIERPLVQGKTGIGDKTTEEALSQMRAVLNYTERKKYVLETEDGTSLLAWSGTMSPSTAWHLRYLVQGLDSSGNYACYHEFKRLKRGASGAPSVLSTQTIETAYEDVPAWDAPFAVAADGTVSVSVLGAAATSIDWTVEVEVMEVPG